MHVVCGWQISSEEELPKCTSVPKVKGFSLKEKEAILDFHNTKRQQILKGVYPGLPKAKEMKMLKFIDNVKHLNLFILETNGILLP